MAYYRIQAEDRAHEQWRAKIEELHKQRAGRMGLGPGGTLNVPQAVPQAGGGTNGGG